MPPNTDRYARSIAAMNSPPILFDWSQRVLCTRVIAEVCRFRGWTPSAINVRTNHVHVVVAASQYPERVMNDLKAWCTRRLREAGLMGTDATVWTRGGSTRYLYTTAAVAAAREYVIERQGRTRGEGEPLTDCQ